jgi:fumarate reductase subunit C
MPEAADVIDRSAVRSGQATRPKGDVAEAKRQLVYEVISAFSGLILALFMWGHMFFVGSILLGYGSFDWLAEALEVVYIAQPTVVVIFTLFLIHAIFASRKIPAQLRERKRFFRLGGELKKASAEWNVSSDSPPIRPHTESWLWIWQVRTGMVMLVLGSFHLILMSMDIFTDLFGDRVGIEALTSVQRTSGGLVWMYALLLICVEFHAGVGLYRLAVKWGSGKRLQRSTLMRMEKFIFWFFLGLGAVVLVVLAGWLPPPLAFLVDG